MGKTMDCWMCFFYYARSHALFIFNSNCCGLYALLQKKRNQTSAVDNRTRLCVVFGRKHSKISTMIHQNPT